MGNREHRSIFVSHVHEDRVVAGWLQDQIVRDFSDDVEVFVSDSEMQAGDDWLRTIEQALNRCSLLVAVCSPVSISRPWVNFELGAAWVLKRRIIPACHGGLTPEDLKSPLSSLHGVTLSSSDGLETLYRTLAERLDFEPAPYPQRGFAQLAGNVPLTEASAVPGGGTSSIALQTVERDRDIRERLRKSLERGHKWRTIGRMATEAAIPEGAALDILRADTQVRFSRGKSGELIVGLIARVGP
jgi:hypothetical protein